MSGFYFKPLERVFLNLSGGTVTGDTIFTEGVYGLRLTGDTIYSGDTNLETIIRDLIISDTYTYIQPGSNITTGGTFNLPTINLNSSPSINNLIFSGTAIGGNIYANQLSGGTIYYSGTDLYDIFSTIESNDITRVQFGLNTYTGGTNNYPSINISAATLDTIIVSGDSQFNSISAITYGGSQIYDFEEHKILGWSSGSISGFNLINNLDGSVTISSGETVLRTSSSQYAPLKYFAITNSTNLTLINNSVNYIYLDYNFGSPIITAGTTITEFNCQDKCIIYKATRSGDVIYSLFAGEQNIDSNRKLRRRYLSSENLFRASGLIIGNTNRNINTTSGRVFFGLEAHDINAFDTSTSNTFTQIYPSGSTWIYTTGNTQINNTQYNNSGNLTTLSNNKYRVDYVYILVDIPDKLYVILGDTEYNNLLTAESSTTPSSLPIELNYLGLLIGRVIIKKNASSINFCQTSFSNLFNPTSVINHNELSGIQGGITDEYYHLSLSEYSTVQNISSHVTTISLSATTISGGTFYGDGSNLTGITQLWTDGGNTSLYPTGFGSTTSTGFGSITAAYNSSSTGIYGSIWGGLGHTNSAYYAAIVGGLSNTISSTASQNYGFIGGGKTNTISGTARHGVILGGESNQLTAGNHSAIVGGVSSTISNQGSFIGGGSNHTISWNYSGLIGGRYNTIHALYSFQGGSYSSDITGWYSGIVGGIDNNVTGYYSGIFGGRNNTVTHANSIALGGSGLTSTADDTVYVPHLNIGSLSATTTGGTYNNLVIDSGGNVLKNNQFYIGVNFEVTGQTWSYVAPEVFKINSIDNPSGLTYTTLVNGSSYTLGNTINLYDNLQLSGVSNTGFLKLNGETI